MPGKIVKNHLPRDYNILFSLLKIKSFNAELVEYNNN